MLNEAKVQATIPVRDLDEAINFYVGTLGMGLVDKESHCVTLAGAGNTHLGIYLSDNAGSNKGTSATWEVADLDQAVNTLKHQGLEFEKYETFTGERIDDGDIFVVDDWRAAWFRDPFGNILCVRTRAE